MVRRSEIVLSGESQRDAVWLVVFAALLLLPIHFYMGNGYGFHRDELQFLDDARHLQWGFAAYPPMTSFCGRLAIALFGISPQVFRLPAALLNAASLVLVGLTAREMGGRRPAQIVAMLAAFPVALVFSSVLQYNTPDMLAWSLLAFSTARVLRTGDGRWWTLAGVSVGFGILSKYTIALPVISLFVGLLLTPSTRRHLRSRWFWYGTCLATFIAAPNLAWLARHQFLTLQMEHAIHLRDVRLGRTNGFFTGQIKNTLFTLPLALAGLLFLLRNRRFRPLAALYLGPLVLFALLRGRDYYLLSAYPLLYAAGSVALEGWLTLQRRPMRHAVTALALLAVVVNVSAVGWAYLPVWPAGCAPWRWQMAHNGDMVDEIGWPEFVQQVAAVRDGLSTEDRAHLAVLANNYGEAGAIALYGPRYGLPAPISTVNSFHARGFGPFVPTVFLITGSSLAEEKNFQHCAVAATVRMPYGIRNEESIYHPQILVCRGLLQALPELWRRSQIFG